MSLVRPRPVSSTPAQRRAASPLGSAWVAASAGTGKTKVLVDRVLNLLLAGTRPQRILCLTFTKAAAQEMALRLADILRKWTTADEQELAEGLAALGVATGDVQRARARRLFADVLDTPGGLRIDTIHAFCQSLLRRFPLEANVPPHFQVLDERSATELRQNCQEAVLEEARRAGEGELAAAVAVITGRANEQRFDEILDELMRERGRLQRLVDGRNGVRRAIERLYRRLELGSGDTEASLRRAACAEASFAAEKLRWAAKALCNAVSKSDRERGERLADWLASEAGRELAFDDYVDLYFTQTLEPRQRLVTKEVIASAPGIDGVLAAEMQRLSVVLERCKTASNAEGTAALLRVGAALAARYRRAKDDRAVLDYDDLILTTRNLLRSPGIAPWVLYKLDGGIDHILVDEAQDTNPEQWEVIEALTGEFFAGEGGDRAERTVFAVGDVKQSIYSFQRAQPEAFVRYGNAFAARAAEASKRFTIEDLIRSYRSTEAVLTAVDAVFATPAARTGVALDGHTIRHETERAGHGGLVELWPAIVPRARAALEPWALPVERQEEDSPPARLAQVIARTIAGLIANKEILESQGRPIRAGDVMILVRRRNVLVDLTVRELKKAGVEVAGVDRMVLADQLAIMDLVALGRFLLLPDDDLTLAVVLKGPLFGFSEEQLFTLAWQRRGTLWDALRERAAEDLTFVAAARELSELLARVDYVRPHELYAEVLGPRHGRRRIVARLGIEANDPLDEFLAAALAFERGHPPALETFLHWLEAGREEVKRDLESHNRDEVRVMTVHGAKGLQAPIVILPDTFQVPRSTTRLFWQEDEPGEPPWLLWSQDGKHDGRIAAEARQHQTLAQQAEYRRLLYVAMTRAQDRLYVCGYQDRTRPSPGCWYKLIEGGLASVAERVEFGEESGVAGSGFRVQCPQRVPVERAAPPVIASVVELPAWWDKPAPGEPDPPKPLVPSRPDGEEPPVRAPFDGGDDTRRFRRGRLVHRLLERLPDLAPAQWEEATRRFLARPTHLLSQSEQDEIARETLAVLTHPQWGALFGEGSVAEAPLVGRVGTRVISGQIDRLVVTPESVLILDYKTNRPPPLAAQDVPPIYIRQMAAYRAAMADVYPGRRLRCALLWTDGPTLMELPDDLLTRHAPAIAGFT